MLNSLTITIDTDKVAIRSEDGSLLSKTSSLVALDERDQVVNVGKAPGELKSKSGIRFLNPFLVEKFHPKFAAIALSRLVGSAISLVSGPKNEAALTKPVEWQIHIPEYERLDKNLQELFEYYVQHFSSASIKSLSINNQQKQIVVFQRIEKVFKLGLVLTACFIQWLRFKGLQLTRPEEMAKPISALDVVMFLTGAVITFYFSAWLYIAICRITLKNIIPIPVYKGMIEDTDLSPKRLWSLLRNRISSKQKGG